MKKATLVLVCLLVSAVGVRAAVNTISGYLDVITPVGEPATLIKMRASGWVFDCGTGRIPGSSTGLLLVDGVAAPALFTYGDYRPDVLAAFGGSCPHMTAWAGFHVDFYATPGAHQLDALMSQPQGSFFISQQPFTAE